MASTPSLTAVDAQVAHGCHPICKPTSCCDMNSPRLDAAQIKDASKRKRVCRNAKLKQYKLDARREQWLSQVSGKNGKGEQQHQPTECTAQESKADPGEVFDPEEPTSKERNPKVLAAEGMRCSRDNDVERGAGKIDEMSRSHLPMRPPESKACFEDGFSNHEQPGALDEEFDELSIFLLSCMSDCYEADSSPKSCGEKSPKSKVSKVGRDCRGGRVWSSSKQDERCLARNYKKEEGNETDNDDVISSLSDGTSSTSCHVEGGSQDIGHSHDSEDDWEVAADALGLQTFPSDKRSVANSSGSPHCESHAGDESSNKSSTPPSSLEVEHESTKPQGQLKTTQAVRLRSASGKAWRPDDTCRPMSLPSLAKQQSLPRENSCEIWASESKTAWNPPPAPTHCPVCTEELDSTDSSFVPCLCGFRLCLFCHHRIASEDGRCPGCRKIYSTDVAIKLSHSPRMSQCA